MATSAPSRIRILLVDDHKTMLWGLDRLIASEEASMEVVGSAADCASALAMATELAPDVVVLDLDLNGTCSLDILPQLAAIPGTRVLVLSGTRERTQLDDAVMRGARGVVGKDAAPEIMLQALRKVHEGDLWLEPGMLGRIFDQMRKPANSEPAPEADPLAVLTVKERRICHLIAEGGGAVNKVLAAQLFISEHTLRNHLTVIYHKLNVGNRLDLYVYLTSPANARRDG
jgi:DNA-binding NarL/FixJ family response regulator